MNRPLKVLKTIVVVIFGVSLSLAATAGGHKGAQKPMQKDIVDTAVGAGSFNTLAAALEAADLVGALKGEGPFTVFAPTDAAFAALPAGTLDSLLLPENKDQLKAILLYHVVAGEIMAADIGAEANPATLQGQKIMVISNGSGVTVNGANVISADVGATNGVIHVIDTVILPPA